MYEYLFIASHLASKDLKYLRIPLYLDTTIAEPKCGHSLAFACSA